MTAAAILVLVACGSDADPIDPTVDGGAVADAAPSADAATDASPWEWWGGEMHGRWHVDRVVCYSGGCQPAWLDTLAAVDVTIGDPAITIDWLNATGAVLRTEPAARAFVNCVMVPPGDYNGRPVGEHALCISMPGDQVARMSVLIGRTDGGGSDEWDVYLKR
jgi:hypothetical protein